MTNPEESPTSASPTPLQRELATLRARVAELEARLGNATPTPLQRANVAGIEVAWDTTRGTCSFEALPVAMMWVETTLAGLLSGMQTMVGTARFALSLQREGRKSVEQDWAVIAQHARFEDGFRAIARIAAVAGWGRWELEAYDAHRRECRFCVWDSWEGRYQRALGVCWGSGMLAGKLAGYCTKLFGTNCWAEQSAFSAGGDDCDRFVVLPSERSLESEIEGLLATGEATRADMAVAVERLRREVEERTRAEDALRRAGEELERRVQERTTELAEAITKLRQEVAERGRVEQSLRESEERFRSIVESSPMGMHMYALESDGTLRFEGANPASTRILGVDHRAFVGKPIEQVFPGAEATALADRYRQVAREGLLWQEEQVEYRDDQIRGAFEVHAFRTSPGRMAAMFLDITRRRRAEEGLRKSEERLRQLAEGIPLPLAILDWARGKLDYVNRAFRNLFGDDLQSGCAASAWFGRAFVDAAECELLKETWRTAVSGGGLESQVRPIGGGIRVIGWRYARLEAGQVLLVGEDLTERKQAERERSALQTKLHRAKKMEALGMLAGGVAHDLNNIFTGIVSYPSLLRLTLPDDSPLRQPLETIEEAGQRAAAVVQDLLTIARGAATSREPCDLNSIVHGYVESVELRSLSCAYPHVRVDTDPDPNLFRVRGSPVHLRKALMNLVTNAVEAAGAEGTVRIVTSNRYVDQPLRGYADVAVGEYVVLRVEDSGPGIADDDLDRIFEPFYTKKIMGRSGTGLGLAVVWNTVQDHSGYVQVTTSQQGTAFELYFPASREPPQRAAEQQHLEALRGHGERILVVDDERGQRQVLSQMLLVLGYRVETAAGGEEAVEALAHQAADLVVLDMIMPNGLSGRETYERMLSVRAPQRAIIASGFAENDDVRAAQQLGAGSFLRKPYTLVQLAAAVRRELDRGGSGKP